MAENILIVDDEPQHRDLLEEILTQAGYAVAQAADGAQGLAQATAAPPDLILLDLLMPAMDGFEVCRRLKSDPATGGIPIIIVTGLGQVTTKETALTSGADDFVTKPIEPADLRARVRAMLKVRRIRQELDRTLAYLHELEATRHAQRRQVLDAVVGGGHPVPPQVPIASPILLVDDEALTRDFYGDLLVEHGFRVFAVGNAAEALDLAARIPVETVILDIMMPGISGLEVLEQLRKRDPDLPVIMLTAHASSRNAIAALKLGAFDFIVKGLHHDMVVLAVHRAIRHRREAHAKEEEAEHLRARIAELEADLSKGQRHKGTP
jgi:two-component system cell cycle response regulator